LSGPAPGGASRGCPCVAPLAMAACYTPTRVCTRLSRRAHCPIVCTRLSRHPSAAPRALQSFCIRLSKQCSSCLQPSPRAAPPSSPSRAGCPSPAPRPVRARRRGPAACRLPIGLASGSPHAPVRRGRAPGGAGGYGLAQGERTSERAAGGHGGGRTRAVEKAFDFPILAFDFPILVLTRATPLAIFAATQGGAH
jgi:hypothetical protein